eukprot:scaffold24022_cov28-Tisochrysis_lutea.AAC.2
MGVGNPGSFSAYNPFYCPCSSVWALSTIAPQLHREPECKHSLSSAVLQPVEVHEMLPSSLAPPTPFW